MDDEDFDPSDAYPIIDQIMADDDAHDPLLETYNRRDSGDTTSPGAQAPGFRVLKKVQSPEGATPPLRAVSPFQGFD